MGREIKVEATTADAYWLVHRGALAFARAEMPGIRVDVPYCEAMMEVLTRRIERLTAELQATKFYRRWEHIYGTKTNIHSNQQLANLLYKHMKVKPPKTTERGRESTDEDSLKRLGIPELDLILQIRKYKKIRDTYLRAFLREQTDGVLHPIFNLHLVRTHRSSSSDPNFQNIPKRDKEALKICRRALLPRPGHMLVEADFAALEVMISACYHKDPVMLEYLRDKNSDMHLDMAKQIFMLEEMSKKIPEHARMRQAAKNGFVFPQFYGDYYVNCARNICDWVGLPIDEKWRPGMGMTLPDGRHISDHLISKGIKSYKDFEEHLREVEQDFWGRRFRVYNDWRKASVEKYRKRGWLRMYTGFVCSGPMRKNEIVNYPIQGSAFHCLLWTFIRMDELMIKEGWRTRLVGQIHDSIIMDVHPDEFEHIKQTLNRIVTEELPAAWKWIIVPLEIEIEAYGVDKPWVKEE